jgi:hypothetical protein
MRHDVDPALRSHFCENFLRCVEEVENFEQHFIMTDECSVSLDGNFLSSDNFCPRARSACRT